MAEITRGQADRMAQDINSSIPKGWQSAADQQEQDRQRIDAIRQVLRKWLGV